MSSINSIQWILVLKLAGKDKLQANDDIKNARNGNYRLKVVGIIDGYDKEQL